MSVLEPSLVQTRGIRIGATPFFLAEQSAPEEGRWVYAYRILIENRGEEVVRLLWRRWVIIDADGDQREVQGSGVVGQQPRLAPGESFEYESFCPLPTPWGTMEGIFTFQTEAGRMIEAAVGRFTMALQDGG